MKTHQPISRKITKIFITGAAILLLFYTIVVENVVLYTENYNSERRLNIVAPFHLKQIQEQEKPQVVVIDPLIKIYSHYYLLPDFVKQQIDEQWLGTTRFVLDNNDEYCVFSSMSHTGRIVYAVEQTTQIEWGDGEFIIVEVILFLFGLCLFLITAGFIINMSNRIAKPFTSLAIQLQHEVDEQLNAINVEGELSQELTQTLEGINCSRARIKEALLREQSFTRYVSHELRTPMTVIKGCLSLLRRHNDPSVDKQVMRINNALHDMEQLTQTFLLLARDTQQTQSSTIVDDHYLSKILESINKRAQSNNVAFEHELVQPISLNAEPILISSLLTNLLFNAINCSIDGHVKLTITPHSIQVIDDGVGLNKKARGYDGFGIGLNVVNDICQKYQWQFSLTNNATQGCCALVTFTDINY